MTLYGRNVLERIYGSNKTIRPTRFSDAAEEMKSSVRNFVHNKVTFIREFPSCTAHNKEKESENIYDRFVKHLSSNADAMESIPLSRLQDSLTMLRGGFRQRTTCCEL